MTLEELHGLIHGAIARYGNDTQVIVVHNPEHPLPEEEYEEIITEVMPDRNNKEIHYFLIHI